MYQKSNCNSFKKGIAYFTGHTLPFNQFSGHDNVYVTSYKIKEDIKVQMGAYSFESISNVNDASGSYNYSHIEHFGNNTGESEVFLKPIDAEKLEKIVTTSVERNALCTYMNNFLPPNKIP